MQYATARIGVDPRQRQPGVPHARARVRAQALRGLDAGPREGVPADRLRRDGARGAPSLPGAEADHRHRGRLGRPEARRAAVQRGGARPTSSATLQFDDAINIQYTSGTTGFPKGATLSHHNILNNGYFIGGVLRVHGAGSRLHPGPLLPLLRHGARQPGVHPHGAAMVIPGESFDPLAVLKTVQDERCTSLYGVPTMFIAELEHPRVQATSTSRRSGPGSWRARPARSR